MVMKIFHFDHNEDYNAEYEYTGYQIDENNFKNKNKKKKKVGKQISDLCYYRWNFIHVELRENQ